MENENTESSRARDAQKTAGQRCSSNGRIIVYIKFEKVYKKRDRCVFYDIVPEDRGKRLKPYVRVDQTFPLADPFWLRKKKNGFSHPCSRTCRVSGQ